MRGAYHRFFDHWPLAIDHNHSDPAKATRYRIGTQRLTLLRTHAEPFAYGHDADGEYVAFLHLLSDGDLHYEMPESTRCEYICGKRTVDGAFMLFAYIWFDSVDDAKTYARRKGLRVEGGWHDKI